MKRSGTVAVEVSKTPGLWYPASRHLVYYEQGQSPGQGRLVFKSVRKQWEKASAAAAGRVVSHGLDGHCATTAQGDDLTQVAALLGIRR